MSGPYAVEVIRDLRIPTGQPGATLAADLYRPVTAAPGPALVTVLPYRKDAWAGLLNEANLRGFASHGYPSLLVDLRGTGSSDGPARPPFHPDDADAGVAAVTWAAAQPWCDGSVGMWGHSYGAVMAMRTAARRPPALRAIVPVMGMTDPERDFAHPAGRRGNLSSVGVWGLHTLLTQLLPPLSADDPAERRRWSERREAEPYLVDLVRHGPGHPVWRTRAVDVSRIEVPALCIAGWHDLFCAATIRDFELLTSPKRLLVGPWTHTMPDAAPFAPTDFVALALPWWERWLRGMDNGADREPAAVLHLPTAGWRAFDTWPPTSAHRSFVNAPGTTRLRPARGSSSAPRPRRAAPVAEHRGDPTAGTLSGFWAMPGDGPAHPLDQHDDDMRCLTLTSGPLPADLVIIGTPTVALWPPAAGTPLAVKLTAVDGAGRSTFITAGDTTGQPAPGQPDAAKLTPTCHVVPAGHRLRVTLNDADFPRLWPPPAGQLVRLGWLALTLPTVDPRDGTPVTVPAPPKTAGPAVDAAAHWVVARDLVGGGVEVRLTEDLTATMAATLRVEREIVAAALPALLRATATASVTPSTGPSRQVRVEFTVTDADVRVLASVAEDGSPTWSRRWSARPSR